MLLTRHAVSPELGDLEAAPTSPSQYRYLAALQQISEVCGNCEVAESVRTTAEEHYI